MPLPTPKDNDKDFISDCMSDEKMKSEFPNHKRRLAVCHSQQKRKKASETEHMTWAEWDFEENYYYIVW